MTQPALRRVLHRPDPDQWRSDELMSILEAAAVFFPDGPLTERSLRTARRDGKLATTMLARRLMTTPAAMRAMGNVTLRSPTDPETDHPEAVMPPDCNRVADAKRVLLQRLAPSRHRRPGAMPID